MLVRAVESHDGGEPAMEVANKVRKAVPEDLPEIGSVLARAFFDDPRVCVGDPR